MILRNWGTVYDPIVHKAQREARLEDVAGNIFAEAPGMAFSLTCEHCDAGDDVHSLEQAKLRGWTRIGVHDGPNWNYMGLCPDCKREGC